MSDPNNDARDACCEWVAALVRMTDQEQRREIDQMFIDLLDAVSQGPLDESVCAAQAAFEDSPGWRALKRNA